MAEKRKITGKFAPRYRKADKAGKTKILDEYLGLVGGNRKYAIFKLGREGKQQLRLIDGRYVNVRVSSGTRRKRVYARYYDEEVKKVLIKLWAFFRFICGERLTPLIKANLQALCRRKRFGITREIKAKLSRISRSTVERLLREERRKQRLKGRSTTKKGTLLKNQIPVRVFWAWDEKKAGFCEIDTVSHDGGGEISPHYAWTLTVTDVALGWTEVRALKNKARKWTLEAADHIAASFPVPIRGLDSDGGGEFINWHFKDWCERRGITFTRGRSHHSNDNCFVEQKNGDVVRKTVGYARFEGEEVYAALAKVYRFLCPLLNYFYPSKKLLSKKRLPNGRVKKIYEKQLKTPFQRLWEDPEIDQAHKERAIQTKATLDIVVLQDNLEKACKELDYLVIKNHG
jgi:transposase InsO family protein